MKNSYYKDIEEGNSAYLREDFKNTNSSNEVILN